MTTPHRQPSTDGGESAFDRALVAGARSLVVETLPDAVLEAPRPVSSRSWLRFEAPLAATAILALAVAVAVGTPRGPGASPATAFRTGTEITYDLRSAGYACHPGATASPGQPRMEAVVCATTTGTPSVAVVVSEDRLGRVGEIHVSIDRPGSADITSDDHQLELVRELIGLPFADPSDAAEARAWLARVLPLDPGDEASVTVHQKPIVIERLASGGYRVVLGDLRAGPSSVPLG